MKPYYDHAGIQIFHGDCREVLPAIPADRCITDPPYGLGIDYLSYEDSLANLRTLIADTFPLLSRFESSLMTSGIGNMWEWPRPIGTGNVND